MEDHYKFSRDAAESDRSVLARYSNHLASLIATSLRTQHKWMLAITGGFHIHPSIPTTVDTPNLRIADVGTGTGIYSTSQKVSVIFKYDPAPCIPPRH
jgi:hypothetical protein